MQYKVTFESPLGFLTLISDGQSVTGIDFADSGIEEQNSCAVLDECKHQIIKYFNRELQSFDLPLSFEGTAFQKKVWLKLRDIPYGETISYKDLAEGVGNAKATRAVGSANGRNPIPIIIPCHRVINSGGKLGGYAGGIRRKQFLLDLETKK